MSNELRRVRDFASKNEVFERVWFNVEERLAKRKKPFWGSIIWRPWAHPGGWVALAACLCVSFTGLQYQQIQADNNDMASYLMTISNSDNYLTHEDNMVNLTSLLTEPSAEMTNILSSDEDQLNILQCDEILL